VGEGASPDFMRFGAELLRARSAKNADSMINPTKTGEENLSDGTI
jgi:hypothetical protein